VTLSKKYYTAIQQVLRNQKSSVSLNTTWKHIHDESGIGSTSLKQLFFTAQDHEALRKWVLLEVGVDPLITEVKGDRLEVASLVQDEKWATKNVFSGMVYVNMRSGEIPISQGRVATPSGTLLYVAAGDILVNDITAVVLMENGIVARNWYKCRVPDELSNALMVYRGHDSEAEAVSLWLKSLPLEVKKVGYFDFDPSGLGMAIDYGVDAILIPDLLDDELVKGINNKQETHVEQLLHRPNLGSQLPKSCYEIWKWMTTENRKCAITQERLTVLGKHLRLLNITDL
jgi:hypothetical protein